MYLFAWLQVIVSEYLDHFERRGKSLPWNSGLPIILSMFHIYFMGKPGYKAIPALFSSLCVCRCVCVHAHLKVEKHALILILSLPVLHVCGFQQRLNGPIRGY